MPAFPPVAVALTVVALALPAAAQSLTDDELLQMFLNQRDAFRAANESETGRTRGLTLVTVDDVEVTTESPSLTAPGAEDGSTTVASGSDGGVSVGVAPLAPAAPDQDPTVPQQVVFGQLAPELQINVHIQFAFDSAALGEDQKPLLTQLCKVMGESDIQLFRIVGHTDASGSDAYNEKLSQLRAEEVQRYLIGDCGIDPGRLEAVGLGERFLADQNDPKAAENRRVEFQALS